MLLRKGGSKMVMKSGIIWVYFKDKANRICGVESKKNSSRLELVFTEIEKTRKGTGLGRKCTWFGTW